jgi:hypothetical protein
MPLEDHDELPVAMNTPIGIANRLVSRGVTRRDLYNRANNFGSEIGNVMQELSLPAFEGWMALFSDLLEKMKANEPPHLLSYRK